MAKSKEKTADSIKREKKFKQLKADLLNQLERSGNEKSYYVDLVNDYMHLYITKTLLQEDINIRGVRVRYDNGGGQSGIKKNDSIEQLLKVNTQMLKILEALEISPEVDDDLEDDEL